MTDMFPEEPPTTNYSLAFEKAWKVHPVGTKKAAWLAGKKAGFTEGNWTWLTNYLEKRHKNDVKWLEGKFVPHLSTFINQERWTDNYKRIRMHVGAQTTAESHSEALGKLHPAVRKAIEERLH